MVRRVLLLYAYANHRHNVERLSSEMAKQDISIDLFCISNGIGSFHTCHFPLYYYILFWTLRSKLFFAFKKKIRPYCIKLLINKYDYIDFHSYNALFKEALDTCIETQKKYDITFWGSDFMRSSLAEKDAMRRSLEYAHCIKTMGKGLAHEVNSYYNDLYEKKTIVVDFGNVEFEYIDSIEKVKPETNSLLHKKDNRMIITCGYNGSKRQNHHLIIDALRKLPDELKAKISVIFPLNYGCTKGYISEIEEELSKIGINYTVLTKYLCLKDIARLRLQTDIMINVQDTDAFSGSVQGHLFAGNILISGEWLKYQELDEADIFYIKTSRELLSQNIRIVLENYEENKWNTKKNKKLMYGISSWQSMIKAWVDSYSL